MTRSLLLLLGSAVATVFSAAHANATEGVVASIKPVHSLVAAVMDGVGTPDLLVNGAGSPHAYSLRPSEARMLEEAKVVFWVGPGLEMFLENPLETLAGNAEIVTLSEAPGLTHLKMREGGAFEAHDEEDHGHEAHDHEEHAHGDTDTHLWLDPENARAMVKQIAATLAKADPDNASAYEDNAAALDARFDSLIADTNEALAEQREKPFIVFHDAYQYYENRFDIPAGGSITVNPEIMPGAQRLSEIRDKIAELSAACVFSEPQFEPKLVSVVTEGTDARSGVLDPLGAVIEDGPELYFTLINNLTQSLVGCLSGEG